MAGVMSQKRSIFNPFKYNTSKHTIEKIDRKYNEYIEK